MTSRRISYGLKHVVKKSSPQPEQQVDSWQSMKCPILLFCRISLEKI